ncbi:hypothetical protein DXG01_005193 [Tephrocybe rancida]|nr:hypothetical protein DXG01_005193 [Tephrocybe rancida]
MELVSAAKDEDDKEWPVKRLLGERGNKYLVEWEDVDPDTNEPWNDTWEKKEDISEDLVADWEAQKAAKQRHTPLWCKPKHTAQARRNESTTSSEQKGHTATLSVGHGESLMLWKEATRNARRLRVVGDSDLDDDEELEAGEAPQGSPLIRKRVHDDSDGEDRDSNALGTPPSNQVKRRRSSVKVKWFQVAIFSLPTITH